MLVKSIINFSRIAVIIAIITSLFWVSHDFISAAPNIEITLNYTEHTVVFPFERFARFVAHITNNSTLTQTVYVQCNGEIPGNWPRVFPSLGSDTKYRLAPGDSADYVIYFEPDLTSPQANLQGETVHASLSFSWSGGSKYFNLTIKTKIISSDELERESVKVMVHILDKSGSNIINNAVISASLRSLIGARPSWAIPTEDGYELTLLSGDYLEEVGQEYQIPHDNIGYILQISAKGCKSYFESNYLPKANVSITVNLETLNQVGEYSILKTIESGFSIWWIKPSADNKYFAFSQGTHGGQPGQISPSQTKVLLTDDKGNVIWERQAGGECWGLDISDDGQYVAAGCHNGSLYVWNRQGDELWHYSNIDQGALDPDAVRVRWVKFSPDGRYLLAGPVKGTPELGGLFDVKSGQLLWSLYTGGFLREGRFSADGSIVYIGADNGIIYAVDTASGKSLWSGSAEHGVPFLLGINEQLGLIVSFGKGLAITALDLNDGTRLWQVIFDSPITASQQMADDGSVVGTAGSMTYAIDCDGFIRWAIKYGGVGHNGVCYTRNGEYVLLGGPNPTLLDGAGNVLWQRVKDKVVPPRTTSMVNTGGANVVWMSEDANLLILGGDDGEITFYSGGVKTGENTYSQIVGFNEPPASSKLTVDDLVINPATVNPNAEIDISVNATNSGRTEEKYTITLKLNGTVETTREITLSPVSNQEVEFNVSKSIAGTYQVDVNGLTGSFEVKQPPVTPTETEEKSSSSNNGLIVMGVVAGLALIGLSIFFIVRKRAG